MRPILIQGAMGSEIEVYLEKFAPVREEIIGEYHFYHGNYKNYPVIVGFTGIGMVNSAASTTLAISKFNPQMIINQGLAGAHTKNLHVGDIVLGEGAVAINSFEKPLLKEGIQHKLWLDTDFYTNKKKFLGDRELLSLFTSAKYDSKEFESPQKIQGVLGSGDVWNREWEFINWLHEHLGSSCEDMETVAMYQLAERFAVPALGVRMISNNELLEEPYREETGRILQEFVLNQMDDLVKLAEKKACL